LQRGDQLVDNLFPRVLYDTGVCKVESVRGPPGNLTQRLAIDLTGECQLI